MECVETQQPSDGKQIIRREMTTLGKAKCWSTLWVWLIFFNWLLFILQHSKELSISCQRSAASFSWILAIQSNLAAGFNKAFRWLSIEKTKQKHEHKEVAKRQLCFSTLLNSDVFSFLFLLWFCRQLYCVLSSEWIINVNCVNWTTDNCSDSVKVVTDVLVSPSFLKVR